MIAPNSNGAEGGGTPATIHPCQRPPVSDRAETKAHDKRRVPSSHGRIRSGAATPSDTGPRRKDPRAPACGATERQPNQGLTLALLYAPRHPLRRPPRKDPRGGLSAVPGPHAARPSMRGPIPVKRLGAGSGVEAATCHAWCGDANATSGRRAVSATRPGLSCLRPSDCSGAPVSVRPAHTTPAWRDRRNRGGPQRFAAARARSSRLRFRSPQVRG